MGETPRTAHDLAADLRALAADMRTPSTVAEFFAETERDRLDRYCARIDAIAESLAGGVGEALPDTPPPDDGLGDDIGLIRSALARVVEQLEEAGYAGFEPAEGLFRLVRDATTYRDELQELRAARGSGVAPQPPDAAPNRHVLVGDLGWLEYAIADYIAKWGEHLTGRPYTGEFGPNTAGMPTAVANMAMTVIRKNLAGRAAAPLPDTDAPPKAHEPTDRDELCRFLDELHDLLCTDVPCVDETLALWRGALDIHDALSSVEHELRRSHTLLPKDRPPTLNELIERGGWECAPSAAAMGAIRKAFPDCTCENCGGRP